MLLIKTDIKATLDSYPKMVYFEKRGSKAEKDCCSICLTKYVDDDVVRIMPNHAHIFHVAYVDEWLRRHPTCPIHRYLELATTSPFRIERYEMSVTE
ncbi:hypothetical protein SUGI_0357860 [Cryptomeria japonica]|nr:hypothetical protein SUGI_0357860 [Cryptomeria japonica]